MSNTPQELLQRCQQRAEEALSESRAAHHRGQLAMEEKRWNDAQRELERCTRFVELSEMFQDHANIFYQMLSGSSFSHEKTKEHIAKVMAFLEN